MNLTVVDLVSISLNLIFLGAILGYLRRENNQQKYIDALLDQQTARGNLVNQIALQIRQPLALDDVLATAVEEVQQFLQADRVLIYRLWNDGTGSVITETVLPPYAQILGTTFPEEVFPRDQHQVYSLGKIRTISNVEQEEVELCLVDFVKQFDVKAKLVVPIVQHLQSGASDRNHHQDFGPTETYLWGLLIVHQCRHPRVWQAWEVELIKYLANQVAIAIQKSELYTQLTQFNADLEQRVQQRTEALAQANAALTAEIGERQQTEMALRTSNQTLNALITASPRAIVMLDCENRVQIWNPSAEHIFGWSEAEVINHPNPLALDHQSLNPADLQTNILQGNTYSRLELNLPRKDGTLIDIVYSAAPLSDSKGQVNGSVAVIADITEQRQQREKLRLLESVVVNTNDAVIVTEAEPIDEPGPRILYVNRAFTKITGYQPEEVIGKTPRILQGPKTDQKELNRVRNALARWEPVTVEVINYRKDGSEFWNELSLVPVANKGGFYTHWIAVQRDTTERKRVEQALRQSEEQFRTLIENTIDIILILDPGGGIRYVNSAVKKVLGYTVTDLLDQNIENFIHQEDWLTSCNRLTNIVQSPEISRPIEFRFRHVDQSWRVLEAISQPFADSSMTQYRMVNARDITERKRLNETRLALEREKELNSLKTRFFSMVSHEFRTPLSTVLAAAQVLEHSLDNSETVVKSLRNLHRIQDSVKNMVKLIDDILTINRAEMGKLACNPRPLNLEFYCQDFLEEIQLSADPLHTFIFASKGQERKIPLDANLFRSILSNLVTNAMKYSPQGGKIWLGLEFGAKDVQIKVRDEGIGILPEDQAHLFEPFHRGKNVRSVPGTGLGLIVVKKCVDLHHGTFELTSEAGQGTTCIVTLPADQA